MSRERCPTCKRALPRPIPKVRKKPRRGPMRDPGYRAWCRVQYCAIRYNNDGAIWYHVVNGRMDPAHTQNNGTGSKGPDSSCAPLCRSHHEEYDSGRAAFEKKYGVDMKQIAAEHYQRYLKEKEK